MFEKVKPVVKAEQAVGGAHNVGKAALASLGGAVFDSLADAG